MLESLEKKDYSAAAELVVMPPGLKPEEFPAAFEGLLRNREISKAGIERLAQQAKFGPSVEQFGKDRAMLFIERAAVPADSVFGFNFETPEATAEVMAAWQNGKYRLIRIDDIGKLEPVSKSTATESPTRDSIKDLLKAIEASPKDASLKAKAAIAYYQENKLSEAWTQMRAATSIEPENEEYNGGIATLLTDLEEAGVFATGKDSRKIASVLGEPDEKIDMGKNQSRWLYSFYGIDLIESKVFSVIDLRGATEALFHPTEMIAVDLDGRNWSAGFRKKEEGLVTKTWFLPSESQTSWTEQFSVERLLDIASMGSAEELANFMIEQMKASTEGLVAQLLHHDDQSATVSFEIPIGKGVAIHRLVRLLKGPKDVHRIGISLVKRPSQATQMKWFKLLQAAKLVPVSEEK